MLHKSRTQTAIFVEGVMARSITVTDKQWEGKQRWVVQGHFLKLQTPF